MRMRLRREATPTFASRKTASAHCPVPTRAGLSAGGKRCLLVPGLDSCASARGLWFR